MFALDEVTMFDGDKEFIRLISLKSYLIAPFNPCFLILFDTKQRFIQLLNPGFSIFFLRKSIPHNTRTLITNLDYKIPIINKNKL